MGRGLHRTIQCLHCITQLRLALHYWFFSNSPFEFVETYPLECDVLRTLDRW